MSQVYNDIELVRSVCEASLKIMACSFRQLEKSVPPPKFVPTPTGNNYRYVEKLPHQAIVLKLARYLSGLRAMQVLIEAGLIQEHGVIQRTVDEIGEDIIFLAFSVTDPTGEGRHKEYLEAFWQEEFDDPDPVRSTQKRPMIRRGSIRAYINRRSGNANVSQIDAVGRTLHSVYSGFVHAAAPHIFDLYLGDPPRFQTDGVTAPYMLLSYYEDGWNYFYRGLMTFIAAARLFGDEETAIYLKENMEIFVKRSGSLHSG